MIRHKGFVLNRKCKNRRMQQGTQGPVIVQGPHLSTISRLFRMQDFVPSHEALKTHKLMDLPPTYAELFTVQAVPTDSPSCEPCQGQSNIDRPPPLPTSTPNLTTRTTTNKIFVASRFAIYLEPPPISTVHWDHSQTTQIKNQLWNES